MSACYKNVVPDRQESSMEYSEIDFYGIGKINEIVTIEELDDTVEKIKTYREEIKKILQRKTKFKVSEINNMMNNRDTFMGYIAAKNHGVATDRLYDLINDDEYSIPKDFFTVNKNKRNKTNE